MEGDYLFQSYHYVTPDALQLDSFKLGMDIVRSNFRPDLMIALWRGGAPIGMYVHEALKFHGIITDHIAIRTSRYTAPGAASSNIVVHNLTYVKDCILAHTNVEKIYNILIVDDVWESGGSIFAVLQRLQKELEGNNPNGVRLDIRFATLFYKPECNKTPLIPNFYVHKKDAHVWIVFPHELDKVELMSEEIQDILKK